jgi:hypothetical protein
MRLMRGEGGGGGGDEWWEAGQRETGAEQATADAEAYGGGGGMVVGWGEEREGRGGYYGELRWNGSSAYPDGAVYTGEIGP